MLVAVAITDTVTSYVCDIDLAAVRSHRHAVGPLPTAIVAIIVSVAVVITDTLLEP